MEILVKVVGVLEMRRERDTVLQEYLASNGQETREINEEET
jgi:hypothetical protein